MRIEQAVVQSGDFRVLLNWVQATLPDMGKRHPFLVNGRAGTSFDQRPQHRIVGIPSALPDLVGSGCIGVAESTGADKRRLKLATFRRWTGRLFDNDYSAQKLAWLPPAGRVGGKRCHGQQFCPECLASDTTPYLRLTWRLSFVTVCPIHKRLLLDRCPDCGEPFNVLRQDSCGHMSCWSCGIDLGRSGGEPPPVDPEAAQTELLTILDQGWMDIRGLAAWAIGLY